MKFLLNPEHFRWLDKIPAPRMPRIRKRGKHNADGFDIVPHAEPLPSSGQRHAPRHAATSSRITLVTDKTVKPPRQPGSPFDTAANPMLTDEETLNLYRRGEEIKRGNWGVIPQREAAEDERLPQVIA